MALIVAANRSRRRQGAGKAGFFEVLLEQSRGGKSARGQDDGSRPVHGAVFRDHAGDLMRGKIVAKQRCNRRPREDRDIGLAADAADQAGLGIGFKPMRRRETIKASCFLRIIEDASAKGPVVAVRRASPGSRA